MLRAIFLSAATGLAFAALTAPSTAAFGPHCSQPRKPFCVDYGNAFKDKSSYNSCRSEVESYVDSVDHYVSCLRDAQRSAIDESNRVVKRFNCQARGETICL